VSISALAPEAFEARYVGGKDPWAFANDAYEQSRYRTTLASLQRPAYGTVYEPGCSVGVLTQLLAAIAKRVIATDFAPSAVEQAKRRCADQANVEIVCADAGAFVPAASLDLVVCGEFIAVHWLGTSQDHILHADQVHEILRESFTLSLQRADRYPGFRLDSWIKP
jgi:SAM-dependent methyltransferase